MRKKDEHDLEYDRGKVKKTKKSKTKKGIDFQTALSRGTNK